MSRLARAARRAAGLRSLRRAALAAAICAAAGCDEAFQPIDDGGDAVYSVYGHLDVMADTQWIRVMPVRTSVVPDAAPLDAEVTLEHLESGRTVTLRDSLFRFRDSRLDSAGYVHNFWTAERLQPGATYRLRVSRSDGAGTTAEVRTPEFPGITVVYRSDQEHLIMTEPALVQLQAERILFTDVHYQIFDTILGKPSEPVVRRERLEGVAGAGQFVLRLYPDSLRYPAANPVVGTLDMRRLELSFVATRGDWPFEHGLPDARAAVPGLLPTNVRNGVGFLGGVAAFRIPLQRCLATGARPDGRRDCVTRITPQSGSVVGRVDAAACTLGGAQAKIRLAQRFADGGAVLLEWQAGWDGSYRFVGLEPGSELVLELGPGIPPVALPRLAPGERHVVPGVPVVSC